MFVLNCYISIKSAKTQQTVSYDYVSDVNIITSLKSFTDTCKLIVPRKLKYKGKDITNYIRRNDAIEVQLGYDDRLNTLFKGYIKTVSTGTPVVIECENEAWKLKQTPGTPKLYPSLKLSDFIAEYMSNYECVTADVNLGEVRIKNETTVAKVFAYFQKNYPLRFFFKDDIFYAGLPSALIVNEQKTVNFETGYNYISDTLKYTCADDVNLQIISKAILKDNTNLEWKEPIKVDGAEVRTFYLPGAKTIDDLKVHSKEMLLKYKVDKMEGDLLAFGEPLITKGDIVHLFDDDSIERNDKKFIAESVNYRFNKDGFRQSVKLGDQVA
ncbi:MAG: hypothetical protein JEY96_17005 [Bacteroidales bacterium]|nr:hypothetical protein [Bacteroidales bacterium]